MKRTANLTGKIGTVTYFPRQRPTGKNGDRRKIGDCPYFSSNERGVALLMALAVLVLMAILAVSFYSSQSLEREGADNARYARSAEAVAESGLNWAMDLLARDEATRDGTLAYDTNYDIWGPLAKDHNPAYLNADDLLFSGNSDEVDLSPLIDGNDARWIDVHDGTRLIGRFAVIVEDESGKANVNVAGNYDGTGILMPRDGISPAEVLLNVVLEQVGNKIGTPLSDPIVSAQEIIALRQGDDGAPGAAGNDDDGDGPLGYRYCDDNLNGVIDEDGDGVDEPDEHDLYALKGDDIMLDDLSTILLAQSIKAYKDANLTNLDKPFEKLLAYLTVNSRTQNVYKVKPADDADTVSQQMILLDGTAAAQTIYDRLKELQDAGRLPLQGPSGDDLDLYQIAANIADFLDEDSNRTELSGKYGMEKTAYLNEIETTPEIYTWNGNEVQDFGEFIELINPYDVKLTVTVQAYQQGPNGEYLPLSMTVEVPARTGDQIGREGYYVIGDTSGWYEYIDPDTGVVTRYYLPTIGQRPGGCDTYRNLHLTGSMAITLTMAGGQTVESTEKDGRIDSAVGGATAQKNDPRLPSWIAGTGGNVRARNNECKPGDSGDKDTNGRLSDVFAIYDGKLGSVGHLGKVYINQPWATIDLTGDDVTDPNKVSSEPTWLNIYDIFTTARDVNQARCGLINVNTAPKEVLAGLKGLSDAVAQQIADYVTDSTRFECIGQLGQFVIPSSGLTWDREKRLADIASLVTVRSSVFRVTVRAQALGRQGEVDKRGERWLQASVERLIDPTTGKVKQVRVLSMRWLVQE